MRAIVFSNSHMAAITLGGLRVPVLRSLPPLRPTTTAVAAAAASAVTAAVAAAACHLSASRFFTVDRRLHNSHLRKNDAMSHLRKDIDAVEAWLLKHDLEPASLFAFLDLGVFSGHATPAALALGELTQLVYHDAVALRRTKRRLMVPLQDYVPAADVGDHMELAPWAQEPCLAPPWRCQLCGHGFLDKPGWALHVAQVHHGEAEYRKRLAHVHELSPPRPIEGQQKRAMVQNFAEFQTHCREGSHTNDWVPGLRAPRQEKACCFCARVDWLENRHRVYLFMDNEEDEADEDDQADEDADEREEEDEDNAEQARERRRLVFRNGGAIVANEAAVNRLLDVQRYPDKKIPPGFLSCLVHSSKAFPCCAAVPKQ